MSSIIEGYNYDIFISYRQKDNKYDGWVTDFVDNLKRELESALKDEVTVYFDINPHDGLLETHDVDASLQKKLKSLIFMPVLSRTYCDSRAFAWEHEFKAFIEMASHDNLGLRITLPGGNVANRVLPVRINDLDSTDIQLCESLLGGVLRPIDFIYKEPGVNRPLRPDEEDPRNNLNHTFYRNQINKIALAVKDIIVGAKEASSMEDPVKAMTGTKISHVKTEEKKVSNKTEKKERITGSGKFKLLAFVFLFLGIFGISMVLLFKHSRKNWAETAALIEIERLRNDNNYTGAFNIALKAEKYSPANAELRDLAASVTSRLTILTDPPGANIYVQEYSDSSGLWQKLGKTPLDSIRVPRRTIWVTRIEKQGFENVVAVISTNSGTINRKLFESGSIPQGMVYVDKIFDQDDENQSPIGVNSLGFFIDRYEVTNSQFKEFINMGGYRDTTFWKYPFVRDGIKISRQEAMKLFVDKSGLPGPSTWEGGDFKESYDDYPVSGISWYEAAAYAEFGGKDLPSVYHWGSACGTDALNLFSTAIGSASNFSRNGPAPVGSYRSLSLYGTYDMAGNVREWCLNPTNVGRAIRGAAWDDASYLYTGTSQLPEFDRSSKNGFRCVRYLEKDKIPQIIFSPVNIGTGRDYYKEKPVPDNTFSLYKNLFLYDKIELDAKTESINSGNRDWTLEKVSYTSPYGNERIPSYLFLPVNTSPPFQVAVFFPGINSMNERDVLSSTGPLSMLDFLLKNGRAVMVPAYKGTYDRSDGVTSNIPGHNHQYTEDLIKWVKDFSRAIDYLETRPEIDTSRLAFIGLSWGGRLGGIIPAIDDRVKLSVLYLGGFNYRTDNWPFPEAEELNYVPRIKVPVLMLNGKYDYNFPYETTVKPFFDLLGTPVKDKKLKIYDTDHYLPKNEVIKETLLWMDTYFGPVNYTGGK